EPHFAESSLPIIAKVNTQLSNSFIDPMRRSLSSWNRPVRLYGVLVKARSQHMAGAFRCCSHNSFFDPAFGDRHRHFCSFRLIRNGSIPLGSCRKIFPRPVQIAVTIKLAGQCFQLTRHIVPVRPTQTVRLQKISQPQPEETIVSVGCVKCSHDGLFHLMKPISAPSSEHSCQTDCPRPAFPAASYPGIRVERKTAVGVNSIQGKCGVARLPLQPD